MGHFRVADWFQERPLTTEWRERRVLVALRDGVTESWRLARDSRWLVSPNAPTIQKIMG